MFANDKSAPDTRGFTSVQIREKSFMEKFSSCAIMSPPKSRVKETGSCAAFSVGFPVEAQPYRKNSGTISAASIFPVMLNFINPEAF